MSSQNQLKWIVAFYDGMFFTKCESYGYGHPRKTFLDLIGLHHFIRYRVADFATDANTSLCQVIEAHFFQGRFSLNFIKSTGNHQKILEHDRPQE